MQKKNIIFDIGGVLFSYENKLQVYYAVENPENNPFKPIFEGLNILKKCYEKKDLQGNRANKLYILSNWNLDPFNLLKKHYPETFELFEGIVISGIVGWKKPDKRIYEYLLTEYEINPEESIFIDDQYENIETAEKLGITSIFCKNHNEVEIKLKKFNLY